MLGILPRLFIWNYCSQIIVLNLFLQAQTLLKNQIEEDSNIMKRMNDDRLVSKNNSQGEWFWPTLSRKIILR